MTLSLLSFGSWSSKSDQISINFKPAISFKVLYHHCLCHNFLFRFFLFLILSICTIFDTTKIVVETQRKRSFWSHLAHLTRVRSPLPCMSIFIASSRFFFSVNLIKRKLLEVARKSQIQSNSNTYLKHSTDTIWSNGKKA